MTTKRALSLFLAIAMILSCAAIFSSCGNNKETEIPKSKRTNVYSESPIETDCDMPYAYNVFTDGKNIVVNYRAAYTVVYNENGEDVERFEGYYYEAGTGFDMGIVDVLSSSKSVAVDDSSESGDGTAAVKGEPDEYGVIIDENQNISVPEGWSVGYLNPEMFAVIPIDGGEAVSSTVELEKAVQSEEGQSYGNTSAVLVSADGNIQVIYCVSRYDETTYASSMKYYIITLDPKTFDVINTRLLNDSFAAAGISDEETYIYNFAMTPDGNIYFSMYDGGIYVVDSDMKFVGKIDAGGDYVEMLRSVGDRVFVGTNDVNYTKQKLNVIENGALKPIEIGSDANVDTYGMIGGYGNRIFFNQDTGIWCLDLETGEFAEELNFINSDIDFTNMGRLLVLEDGRMVVMNYSWKNDKTTFSILTKVPDEEIKEEVMVTIGTIYPDYDLVRKIMAFNKQNTGVRVNIKTYSQYNNEENEYQGAQTQLNNEIISGSLPDIVCLTSSLPVQSYFQKGVFVDLNKYVDDTEKGIDRSKYLDNILRANELNGKLYSLITAFSISTLAAKTEFVGTHQGWTFEEMVNAIKNMPEGMEAFYGTNRDEILSGFFASGMNSLVDWKTGETKFDSPEFIEFIKYLATCPEKGPWEEYYDAMGDNYEYDADAEHQIEEDLSLKFLKNKCLFSEVDIATFDSLPYLYGLFATRDVIFVGYPAYAEEGNGAVVKPINELAISSKSKVKEQAWEFLKFMLTSWDEYDWLFSLNRERLAELQQTALDNAEKYGDSEVLRMDYDWMSEMGYSEEYINYVKNSNVKLDKEMTDIVLDMVENASVISRTDSELIDIINEELSGFFAGTRTAEDTARVIAGRAKTFISERS